MPRPQTGSATLKRGFFFESMEDQNYVELPDGDVRLGKKIFSQQCGGCHSMKTNASGPRLDGVYGRKMGGVRGFRYSIAFRAAGGSVWDRFQLNSMLKDPEQYFGIEGDMTYPGLKCQSSRASLIEYLHYVKVHKKTNFPKAWIK